MLAENLAAAFGRPAWNVSFHVNLDASGLVGTDTFTDGLVLRAAGELLEVPPEQKRLLLLLTDASPNDSRRIPPGGKYPFGRDYAGAPAAEDAAREVRALRKRGVRVGAVFMGPSLNVPAAEAIYGKSLAPIRSMDRLAAAAGSLIRAEIRELE